jgi:hypothetical protein
MKTLTSFIALMAQGAMSAFSSVASIAETAIATFVPKSALAMAGYPGQELDARSVDGEPRVWADERKQADLMAQLQAGADASAFTDLTTEAARVDGTSVHTKQVRHVPGTWASDSVNHTTVEHAAGQKRHC